MRSRSASSCCGPGNNRAERREQPRKRWSAPVRVRQGVHSAGYTAEGIFRRKMPPVQRFRRQLPHKSGHRGRRGVRCGTLLRPGARIRFSTLPSEYCRTRSAAGSCTDCSLYCNSQVPHFQWFRRAVTGTAGRSHAR